MNATTTKHHIMSTNMDFAEHAQQIRAGLFGELVRLAAPIVKRYESDLFHDAEWLREAVNGEITFHYAVRENGTHVETPSWGGNFVESITTTFPTSEIHKITLVHDRWDWNVITERVR